jgi:hypothetical protein
VLDEQSADDLAEALASTHVASEEGLLWARIKADLHEKQRRVLDDPAREKCLEKGRRAGGSHVVAAWLLEDWHLWAGHTSLFAALTKEHAKRILWPTLIKLNREYGLGLEFRSSPDLVVTAPNGYRILLCGAKDSDQIEKLRGIAGGLRRACIDEAGSFGVHNDKFVYLLDSVISPQFMDTMHLGGGQLILCGSPGIDPMGFYYERCTGTNHLGEPAQKWSTHHWTALDNPTVDAKAYLLEKIGPHILDDTSPEQMVAWIVEFNHLPLSDQLWAPVLARLSASFRREYLADWVIDHSALVYTTSERNMLPVGWELPRNEPWRITIGCDRGWGDGNGFCVAAKSLRTRDIILLEAYYRPSMGSDEIAAEVAMLKQKWRSGEAYMDTGGEGDQVVVDMDNYGTLVEKAKKGKKKPRIEYVRALLKSGSLKIRPEFCADVLTEWTALPWSEDRQTHREGFVDDVSDSVLYAVWPLSQRFVPGKRPRPQPGTAEARKQQEDEEFNRSQRKGKRLVRKIKPARRVAYREAA